MGVGQRGDSLTLQSCLGEANQELLLLSLSAIHANVFYGDGSNLEGVEATDITDGAVTTAKIDDSAVTTAKIPDEEIDHDTQLTVCKSRAISDMLVLDL